MTSTGWLPAAEAGGPVATFVVTDTNDSGPGSLRHAILGNSIFGNRGLGIDLGASGTDPNDTLDADDGPNDLQNRPVLTSATVQGGVTHVTGRLRSTPDATFRIELFRVGTCDPSGSGEGGLFLGATDATTNAGGLAVFSVDLPRVNPNKSSITATATNAGGSTSEFSACRRARQP
jgi:titin